MAAAVAVTMGMTGPASGKTDGPGAAAPATSKALATAM